MATPAEISALIEQAWNLNPEEHFFEFLYDVVQTNSTLFALGESTNDQIKEALEAYIAAGGPDEQDSSTDPEAVDGDPQGDTVS